MTRLTDDQVIAIISPDMDSAKEFQQELSAERRRLYGVYRAAKYGNEAPNWSQSVHPTVFNAVEWLKPGLFEVFTGDFFSFSPKQKYPDQPEEEAQAAVESAKRLKAYIRYKLFDQMDGEQIIEDFIHYALVSHYGVLKICHRDDYDVETETLDRVSGEELLQLASDANTIDIRGGEQVSDLDPVTQMPIWSGVQGATIVRKKQIYNGFHLEVVPPWELYMLPGYDTLDKNPFVAHRVKRSLDYIKRQELAGVYTKGVYERVKDHVDERDEQPETADELQLLHDVDNLSSPDTLRRQSSTEPQKLAANEVWVWECYCRLDMKQNGFLQPMIVTVCEDVILREPVPNPYGTAPFELGYTSKEPHKIVGRPIPAILEDRQKVMSNLLRNIQDSAARTTYGGWLTSSHQTKLLLQKMGPGDVAWTPDINTVKEIAPSAPSQYIFEAFSLTKAEISAESGVNENMQGLDDNSLNKTAAGMNMRMTAGMQRQKLFARRLARSWRRILRRILDIMRMWPPEDDVEMVGGDIVIRPEDLHAHYSIDIEVGVGSHDRQNQAQMLEQLIVFGTQVGLPSGMMTKEQIVAAQKAKFEYLDMDVTEFIQSPDAMAQADEHQMQMQQAMEQTQQMQMQMEQAGKEIQTAQQQVMALENENQALKNAPPEDKSLEIAKFQLEAEIAREKMALEREKLELERMKLQLEAQKIAVDAELKAQSANDAREMAYMKQSQPKSEGKDAK